MIRRCEFSADRVYRYTLWRTFYPVLAIAPPLLPVAGNGTHNYLMVIGLNPSTADERQDDPTIRRCKGFAEAWGFGALCMTNLFAIRGTDPGIALAHPAPTGPENDAWLRAAAAGAGLVVAAWGDRGNFNRRNAEVESLLKGKLHCLRFTKTGQPEHPLYLPKTLRPQFYA